MTLLQRLDFRRYLQIVRLIFSAILCFAFACFVYTTIHWQIMWDPSIMHYVNFLMAHGLAPYRDIIDINMPGCYFIDGWVMHIFGGGDLGWRLFDFSLIGVLTGSLIVISLPFDWLAGLLAGVLFMLVHALEGPPNAGQREQIMITLIMVGYALLFTAMRRQKPLLMLLFGFVLGLAASLKPTAAPLGLILLLMMAIVLRRKAIPVKRYVTYGLIGLFAALLINVEFLFRYHVFGAFFAIGKRLIPYYASVGNASLSDLLRDLLLQPMLVPLAVGIVPLVIVIVLTFVNGTRTEWERWERLALGLGLLFGAFSYIAQGKIFNHHAYTFKVFLLLWFALECAKAMRTRGWRHFVGLAAIGYCVLVMVPGATRRVAWLVPMNKEPDALKSDLIRLGGSTLQYQVQCLDMVAACDSTLYRLHLIQNTGFLGDYMFFGPPGSPPLPYYREMFWNDLHKNPPKIIVLTNMWLCERESYAKVNQWPQMAAYLDSAYTVDVTRLFGRRGYKILVLKDGIKSIGSPMRP